MSYHEHPGALRLEIDHEADALIFYAGAEAYSMARQRAEESSSDEMAKAWTGVAAAIGRRAAKRRPLLSYLLHERGRFRNASTGFVVFNAGKSAAARA